MKKNTATTTTTTATLITQLSALHPVPDVQRARISKDLLRYDPAAWSAAREELLLQLLDEFEEFREGLIEEIMSRPDYHYTPEGLTRLLNYHRALDDLSIKMAVKYGGDEIDLANRLARIEKRKKYLDDGSSTPAATPRRTRGRPKRTSG
jgi:hypothetical protein